MRDLIPAARCDNTKEATKKQKIYKYKLYVSSSAGIEMGWFVGSPFGWVSFLYLPFAVGLFDADGIYGGQFVPVLAIGLDQAIDIAL